MANADIAELGLSIRSDGVVVATDRLGRFQRQAGGAERATQQLTRAAARMATVVGAAFAAAFSVRTLFAYQDALAEVSTLVDTTTFSMSDLSDAALEQGAAFGNVVGQVQAYYQIISAGASSVAEATDILTASNRLAIGGVTDIGTAADGLTSILNAYGDRVEGATAVSDALFTAMRAGKTTIGELSATLGRVAPLAAQTGVGFDELTAAIAALTKGGISTAESVTGVRAILAAVAKPTSEAVELSEKLGLEFNSTALQAQGLAGFMEELVDKTGGSTDALAQLFGGVEALVPVMALAGQAGEDFNAILDQMEDKAGATEEAFNKMAASPGFQAQRLFSALQVEAIKLTFALGEQLVPAMAFLADNADKLPVILGGVAAAAGVLLVPAIVSATAAVAAFTAALLTNPLFLFAAAVGAVAAALIDAEQKTAAHRDRLVENANAIEVAKTASASYRSELQGTILTQIALAEAELAEAAAAYQQRQQWAANARVLPILGGAIAGAIEAINLGLGGPAIDAANQRVAELKEQFELLRIVIRDIPPATEPVVHSVEEVTGAFSGLGEEVEDTLTEAEKAAISLAQSLEQTLGNALNSLFDGVTDLRDALGGLLNAFAQLGQQNLASLTTGLFGSTTIGGAANDNGPSIWDGLQEAVKEGAQQGTAEGSFAGIRGFLQNNAGSISAGLGGLGIGFQSQSPIMGGIGGALSGFAAGGPIGALIGGIGGLIGGLLGMNEALQKARQKVEENRNAIEQFIAAARGEQLSGFAQTLANIRDQAAELISLAETAQDWALVEELKAARDAARETLGREFQDDLRRSINALQGNDYLNEIAAAQDRYNERLRDAAALGVSAAGAGEEFNLSILKIARSGDLTERQLRDLAFRFPSLNSAITGIIEGAKLAEQIADAETRVSGAKADLRRAYDAERTALESTIGRLEQFRQSIETFKGSLLFDSGLSPLSPTERLAEAQNLFRGISDAALSGDATAQGRLQDVARTYLQEARQFYGSGAGYQSIFANVQGVLDQAISTAGGQIAGAQNQLEALNRQTSALIDIGNNTKSMAEATRDLKTIMAELRQLQAQVGAQQIEATNNVSHEISIMREEVRRGSNRQAA